MTGLALNKNWDIYLNSSGDLATIDKATELIQNITSALKLWIGEYQFNINLGIPFLALLSNPHLDANLINYHITNAIENENNYLNATQKKEYGVKNINNIEYFIDSNRQLKLNVEIELQNQAHPIILEI
jgi:hypothetical protein